MDLNVSEKTVDFLLYNSTRGKKKKAFLKWLRGIGAPIEVINEYSKWIAQKGGIAPYSYNWYTFKWYYILNNY